MMDPGELLAFERERMELKNRELDLQTWWLATKLNNYLGRWLHARRASDALLSKRERVIKRVRCELGAAADQIIDELIKHADAFPEQHDPLLDAMLAWLDERDVEIVGHKERNPRWFADLVNKEQLVQPLPLKVKQASRKELRAIGYLEARKKWSR